MRCGHPDCTGKHRNTIRLAERCPAAIERKREWCLNRHYDPTPKQQLALHGYRLKDRRHKALKRGRKASDDEILSAMGRAFLAFSGGRREVTSA